MKNLKNLGEILKKEEQQSINGGWLGLDIIHQSCNTNSDCTRPGHYCRGGFCLDMNK